MSRMKFQQVYKSVQNMFRPNLFLTLFLCLLCCNGCWDRKELKTQSLIAAMGVDRPTSGKAGKYFYTFQVIKPGEVAQPKGKGGGGGSGGAPVWIGTSEGRTPYEAGRNIVFQSSRRFFFAHNQALIFGKDLAKQGVRPPLDIDLRFAQVRLLEWVLIAKGTAKEVLEVPGGLEKIPGFDISGMIGNAKYSSEVLPVTLEDFFGYVISKTQAPVAPQIEVFTAGKEKRLRMAGTAVFKKDRWIGELNKVETRGLLWVLGKVKRGVINIPSRSETDTAVAEINAASCKIQPEIRHGKIIIRLQIDTVGNLQNIINPDNLTTPDKLDKQLHKLEKWEAAVIRREIRVAWKKACDLNADIFGFGEAVHRKYPRRWKTIEPQWGKFYPRIILRIAVHTTLKQVGEIAEPLIPLLK